MPNDQLVYIDAHGLLGSNFYWRNFEAKGLTKDDITAAGLVSDQVQVYRGIIRHLVVINTILQQQGYKLYIKEGYRSQALYQIIYKRRVEKFGQVETDRILNMDDMPHSNGLSVDISILDAETNKEICLRNGEDGTDALFVDFYKDKDDEGSRHYQTLQEWLIKLMQNQGFRLGTKHEYFHFDYKPDTPRNYPIS